MLLLGAIQRHFRENVTQTFAVQQFKIKKTFQWFKADLTPL